MDLAGEPMLVRGINRISRAKNIDQIVITTTDKPADEAIVHLCDKHGWAVFQGSENDVLDRYYQTALHFQAKAIVRITSDCPLIEPIIIDRVISDFLDNQPKVLYASNLLPYRSFPRGLDTEVIRFDALEQAWKEDTNPAWREHVTQYIIRNPNKFPSLGISNEIDLSEMRWTVDTIEDLSFVRKIYDHFENDLFNWEQVLELLDMHPEWLEINKYVKQKVV